MSASLCKGPSFITWPQCFCTAALGAIIRKNAPAHINTQKRRHQPRLKHVQVCRRANCHRNETFVWRRTTRRSHWFVTWLLFWPAQKKIPRKGGGGVGGIKLAPGSNWSLRMMFEMNEIPLPGQTVCDNMKQPLPFALHSAYLMEHCSYNCKKKKKRTSEVTYDSFPAKQPLPKSCWFQSVQPVQHCSLRHRILLKPAVLTPNSLHLKWVTVDIGPIKHSSSRYTLGLLCMPRLVYKLAEALDCCEPASVYGLALSYRNVASHTAERCERS